MLQIEHPTSFKGVGDKSSIRVIGPPRSQPPRGQENGLAQTLSVYICYKKKLLHAASTRIAAPS